MSLRKPAAWPAVLLAACGLLLAACPRQLTPEQAELRRSADSRYPWPTPRELRSNTPGDPAAGQQADPAAESTLGTPFELPNDLGRHPAIQRRDTVDTGLLLGDWALVCHADSERLVLHEPGSLRLFSFNPGGQLNLLTVQDGQLQHTQSGRWEKTGPGRMQISVDNSPPLTYYCEMFGSNFFYLWTFATKNGLWLVRRPAESAPQIAAGEFQFASGETLKFTSVRGAVFNGYIDGPGRYEVTGGYYQGILSLRWVQPQSQSQGYAAFVVDRDWTQLDGAWWLDDYEAAPFGGSWSTAPGQAASTAAPPPAAASESEQIAETAA